MKSEKYKFILCAVMAVIISASAQTTIPLPFGVPLTMQTAAVCICGYFLGKSGVFSVLTYIFLGLIGLPVFSSFSGGVGVLFGKGGGFILGFVPLCIMCGIGKNFKKRITRLLFGFLGIIICHTVGVLWFSYFFKTDIISSFILTSLPYLLKDFLSALAAEYTVKKFLKA